MLQVAEDIKALSQVYVSEFNAFCGEYDLVGKVRADHLGIKCSHTKIYESHKALFEKESRFIYQSIIAGRRISIIGLREGVDTFVGPLNYLELADQKQDGSQTDRIDHLEIIPTTCSYKELIAHLSEKGVTLKETVRAHHTTYDIVLPSGFSIKLSREMLIDKIKREEMK